MNKINWLYNIAENIITKYPEFDIFKYLPLTKAGNFIKGKSILIASTDMNDIRDDEYHTKNTLQLRLYPIKTETVCHAGKRNMNHKKGDTSETNYNRSDRIWCIKPRIRKQNRFIQFSCKR